MAAWTEQQARDKLTDYFITTDPLLIALQRPVWITTSAGGKVQSGVDELEPQMFHVYPFKRRLTQEYHYNPQTLGEEKVEFIHWILIFTRGADIQEDDFFDPTLNISPMTDRLESGLYTVTFISARLWDRGQAGILFRG